MTTPTVTPYKQLRRPVDDRIVAGVCSALGRYFKVDPVLVRVTFAAAAVLTWGVALLAYPIMWFLIPEADALSQAAPTPYTPPTLTHNTPHPPSAGSNPDNDLNP